MERAIIGREKEKMELKKYISSEQSEFVAIYGRRRVGKTFLVKELLEGKFTFRIKQTVLNYALGNGVKKDLYSAATWSAKMNVEDQLAIARKFYYGEGVKKNMDLPVTIWKRLSEQYVFKAINNLALLNIWGGNYGEAERLIGSIDKIPNMDYPTRESESYYLMGILREAQGRYQQALDCYKNSRKEEAKRSYDKLHDRWKRNNFR